MKTGIELIAESISVPLWAVFVGIIVAIILGGMIVGALWRDQSNGYFGTIPVQGCLTVIGTAFLLLVTLAIWGWVT
jgi:hypothetical protein